MARLSKKRSDKRWQTEDGDVWASKLEAIIFERLNGRTDVSVRRCSEQEGDTFAYTTGVRSGCCGACGSGDIVQRRTYPPDLCLSPRSASVPGYDTPKRYLEIKGYFPGPK